MESHCTLRFGFYKGVKAKSQSDIRLRPCKSIFIFFLYNCFTFYNQLAPSYVNFRAKIALNAVICMIFFFYIFLDNGFMTTWKRRILSFVFTVLIPFRERLSKYAIC